MDEAEPPECPVCLQPYDTISAIPRVLGCGHTTCEACLNQLPNPFPHTLRCTVCTSLVKFPNSPSFLPKNLDLLHLSSLLQHKPKPVISHNKDTEKHDDHSSVSTTFVPKPWSYEFYRTWRNWIIPNGAVLLENPSKGKILKGFGRDSIMGFALREETEVGLVKVGIFNDENQSSTKFFDYSYELKIMSFVHNMKENERAEMCLILNASWRVRGVGKAYGFWYCEDDKCVYMVFEKFDSHGLFRRLIDKEGEGKRLSDDDLSLFGIIGMELCEVLCGLHSEGLIIGCLDVSCFGFDEFGRIYIDPAEVLAMGRRVNSVFRRGSKDLEVSLKNEMVENLVFISPEMVLEFFKKKGVELDCENSAHRVGYGTDVWSLARLLVWLIVGRSASEASETYLLSVSDDVNDDLGSDFFGLYMAWMEKIIARLGSRIDSKLIFLKEIISQSLEFDPANRPSITELWKCLRALVIEPNFDFEVGVSLEKGNERTLQCVVLGEFCQIGKETSEEVINCLLRKEENDKSNLNHIGHKVKMDVVEGLSEGHMKCVEMKGHLDGISGLAVGGGFLFSSSYDKKVNVWSLKDYAHVHSFHGHEHRVMALALANGGQPLCISGDKEGVICIWKASYPFDQVPLKKLHEEKDWRYSGIHAMACSGTQYLYTGSGDRLVKAWSLQDYTVSCTMSGHTSVVSSLVVSHGVLYSGSWDGTIRLWSLSDHSPLAVLGEETPGKTSIMSLALDSELLIAAHENGCLKIWHNNILLKSIQAHKGAIFSTSKQGNLLFTGGWDKTINVQEISGNGDQIDCLTVGSIAGGSVITALLYWQEKLFVGQADRIIKVFYGVQEAN